MTFLDFKPLLMRKALMPELEACYDVPIREVLQTPAPEEFLQLFETSTIVGKLLAAARSVWFVVEDDTGLKTVCCDKNNLSENKNGFTYRLENGAVMIIDESVETTAGTELAKESKRLHSTGDAEKIGRPTLELDEAVDFVQEIMKDGTRSVSEIKAEAISAGLSWTTVKRARSKAGYEAIRTEDGWAWRPAFWMTDSAPTPQGQF